MLSKLLSQLVLRMINSNERKYSLELLLLLFTTTTTKRIINKFVCVCVYIYIYIYIYVSTDCFIVSQLFSVARHVGRFKLGLKPAQLYVRPSIIPLGHQSKYVRSGIIRHYVVAFVGLHFALPDTRMLNS